MFVQIEVVGFFAGVLVVGIVGTLILKDIFDD